MSGLGDHRPRLAQGLEINAVSDGYVVHDDRNGRVHYLNRTGAILLELCNGRVAENEMPGLLQQAFQLRQPPESEVEECLSTLRRERLIR